MRIFLAVILSIFVLVLLLFMLASMRMSYVSRNYQDIQSRYSSWAVAINRGFLLSSEEAGTVPMSDIYFMYSGSDSPCGAKRECEPGNGYAFKRRGAGGQLASGPTGACRVAWVLQVGCVAGLEAALDGMPEYYLCIDGRVVDDAMLMADLKGILSAPCDYLYPCDSKCIAENGDARNGIWRDDTLSWDWLGCSDFSADKIADIQVIVSRGGHDRLGCRDIEANRLEELLIK